MIGHDAQDTGCNILSLLPDNDNDRTYNIFQNLSLRQENSAQEFSVLQYCIKLNDLICPD